MVTLDDNAADAFVPGRRFERPPLGNGRLSGLKFAVKDLFDIAGSITTYGNPDWAASHPAETVAYIARESGSTDEWVRKAYGGDVHLHQGTDLEPASVAALSGYKDFLSKTGFIEKDFSVAAWIDPAPLERVLAQRERKAA